MRHKTRTVLRVQVRVSEICMHAPETEKERPSLLFLKQAFSLFHPITAMLTEDALTSEHGARANAHGASVRLEPAARWR